MSENWNFDCIGWFVIESDLGPTWSHNGDINEQSFTSPQTFLDIAGPLTRTPGAETLMGTGVPSFLQALGGMPAIWNHHHMLASKCRAVLKLCDSQTRPYRQKESQLFPGAFSSWLSGRKRASCDCVHGALVSFNRCFRSLRTDGLRIFHWEWHAWLGPVCCVESQLGHIRHHKQCCGCWFESCSLWNETFAHTNTRNSVGLVCWVTCIFVSLSAHLSCNLRTALCTIIISWFTKGRLVTLVQWDHSQLQRFFAWTPAKLVKHVFANST